MTYQETEANKHYKNFKKHFNMLSRKYNSWTVFNDYLDICICCYSLGAMEEEYLKITRRYQKDEINDFVCMMAEMVMFMDNGERKGDSSDYAIGTNEMLGDIFMDHFSSKFKGQFFTPKDLCHLKAQITMGTSKEDIEAMIDKTVCDPAVGSGRTLLAVKAIQPRMIFYGADLDETCCKMSAINLLLNGMKGEIAHMNSLSMKYWKSYHILRLPNRIVVSNDKSKSGFFRQSARIAKGISEENSKKQNKSAEKNEMVSEVSLPSEDRERLNKPDKNDFGPQLTLFD